MGGFINSQADSEICEVLNKRFSDQINPNDAQRRTFIAELRDHFQNREHFLDGNHHLHRVFHRLAISVTSGVRVPKRNQSRFRWLFLLRSSLPPAVTRAIKGQLTAILSPASGANPAGGIDYATFLTRHVATSTGTFELWSQNSTTPVVYSDANGKSYCKIVLECNTDAALPDSPNETDPPNPDGGETSFAVRRIPAKKSAKKTSAKKSAVKKSSRKKTATKKRKARK
jgi:hypothetical protein